ncbi:hypothetical protein LTR50_006127 [Elasticomyces elasticus]|nr:hypothetical protein LTR50_006127 [Elasticomyces elasticus]
MLLSYIVAALSAILTIFTAFPGPVLRFGVNTATLGAHILGLLPSPGNSIENSTIAPPPDYDLFFDTDILFGNATSKSFAAFTSFDLPYTWFDITMVSSAILLFLYMSWTMLSEDVSENVPLSTEEDLATPTAQPRTVDGESSSSTSIIYPDEMAEVCRLLYENTRILQRYRTESSRRIGDLERRLEEARNERLAAIASYSALEKQKEQDFEKAYVEYLVSYSALDEEKEQVLDKARIDYLASYSALENDMEQQITALTARYQKAEALAEEMTRESERYHMKNCAIGASLVSMRRHADKIEGKVEGAERSRDEAEETSKRLEEAERPAVRKAEETLKRLEEAGRKAEETSGRLEEAEKSRKELEARTRSLRESSDSKVARIQELETENGVLKALSTTKSQEAEKARLELKSQTRALRESSDAQVAQIRALEAEVAALKTSSASKTEDVARIRELEAENEVLKALSSSKTEDAVRIRDLEAEIAAFGTSKLDDIARIRDLEAENVALKGSDSTMTEQAKGLSAELQKAMSSLDQARSESASAREGMAKLAADRDRLKREALVAAETPKKLQKRCGQLEAELTRTTTKFSQQLKEMQAKTKGPSSEVLGQAEAKFAAVDGERLQNAAEVRQLQSSLEGTVRERDEARSTLEGVRGELETAKGNLVRADALYAEHQEAKKQLQDAGNKLLLADRLYYEHEGLKQKLAQMEGAAQGASSHMDLDSIFRERDAAQSALEALRKDFEQATEKLSAVEADRNLKTMRVFKLESSVECRVRERDDAQRGLEAAEEMMGDLRQDVEFAKFSADQLKEQVRKLEATAKASEGERDDAKGELEGLGEELQRRKNKLSATEKKVTEKNKYIEKCEERLSATQNELDAVKAACSCGAKGQDHPMG